MSSGQGFGDRHNGERPSALRIVMPSTAFGFGFSPPLDRGPIVAGPPPSIPAGALYIDGEPLYIDGEPLTID